MTSLLINNAYNAAENSSNKLLKQICDNTTPIRKVVASGLFSIFLNFGYS